jgi:hypothetical protein
MRRIAFVLLLRFDCFLSWQPSRRSTAARLVTTQAGNGCSHGAGLPAIRRAHADPRFRCQTCRCWLFPRVAWSRAASHLLRSFLFDVSPFDPGVRAFSAIVMLLLALAGSVLPARRASGTDAMLALGGE